MQLRFRVTFVVLAGSLLSVAASAQNRFCIGGDIARLSVAQKDTCRAKLDQVRAAAAKFHAPAEWHFVVVCGESGWKDYASFSKRSEGELETAAADTDLEERSTYFRGERLGSTEAGGSVERVVAHEIASIVLHTNDERAIRKQMAVWIPERSGDGAVLEASLGRAGTR